MLPFEPEPLSSLQARYSAALERVWPIPILAAAHARGEDTDRPGLHRCYVFDFEDGLRLIVSREMMTNETTVVHFSASLNRGDNELTRIGTKKAQEGWARGEFLQWFKRLSVNAFRELSGEKRVPKFEGLSAPPAEIPHWTLVCEEGWAK